MKQEKNAKIGRWKAGLLATLMCVGVTVAYAQQVKGTVLDKNKKPTTQIGRASCRERV